MDLHIGGPPSVVWSAAADDNDACLVRDDLPEPTNDKAVDGKAVAQFGITTINEVIQVKRQQNNIQRPVLDMLRGSLHRFKASSRPLAFTTQDSLGLGRGKPIDQLTVQFSKCSIRATAETDSLR
jgi:hypothetical protein